LFGKVLDFLARYSHASLRLCLNRAIITPPQGREDVMRMKLLVITASYLLAFVPMATPAKAANDYPTVAVADYVLGCMISNGRTREILERCSCSIDVISSIISYDKYVTAETFGRMAQTTGEKSALFHQTLPSRQSAAEIRRAQAEADIRCF